MVKQEMEKFFNMPAGAYCGVLLREPAMKKMQKLLYKQTQEIKRLLTESLDDIEVANWTLAYPDGVQTTVHYFDAASTETEKVERIELFNKADKMQFTDYKVFSSDKKYSESMKEVEQFATEYLASE